MEDSTDLDPNSPLIAAVLERLELPTPTAPSAEWLADAYRSFCRHVPFANLDKLSAVRNGQPLPSVAPAAVLQRWVDAGAGGTCFAHNMAFSALLRVLGYNAYNLAGRSMDPVKGVEGAHVSTLVELAGATWLADTALPHGVPLRLYRDRCSSIDGVMTPMVVTPSAEYWSIAFQVAHSGERKEVVLEEPLNRVSRAQALWRETLDVHDNPFNAIPILRLEVEGGSMTLVVHKLFHTSLDGETREEKVDVGALARFGVREEVYGWLWRRPG